MHKTLGTVLEESQDALSTQILYRAFKNQFLNVWILEKKRQCDKEYAEKPSKFFYQRERDKNNNTQ